MRKAEIGLQGQIGNQFYLELARENRARKAARDREENAAMERPMAKQKTKDTTVINESSLVPIVGNGKLESREQKRLALSKMKSVDEVMEEIWGNDKAFDALDAAKEADLASEVDTLIHMTEVGDTFRGFYLGKGILEREEGEDLDELWFAIRGDDGTKRTRKLHATTGLKAAFESISPGWPVQVTLAELIPTKPPKAPFKRFEVRPLKKNLTK